MRRKGEYKSWTNPARMSANIHSTPKLMLKSNFVNPTLTKLSVYPAIGYPVADSGMWRVTVSGFAWHPPGELNRRQRMMIGMLRNVMGVTQEQLQTPTFESRINQFMATACSKLVLAIKINGQLFSIRKSTRRNGSFSDVVSVPKTLLSSKAVDAGNVDAADFSLVSESGDHVFTSGKILLYPRRGLSIVSDIDDTIKDSQVGDRKELLANTFLREFRSIEGMADLYSDWAGQGAAFHYVSSSPWQLLEALTAFNNEGGFPDGSMHLRNFRLRDQLLRKLVLRRNGKVIAIRKLLQALPDREFVLIGDSGEKDPKIYRKICKQFPGRVKAVFIRNLDHRKFEPENLAKLARSIPLGICGSYQDSGGLRESAAPLFL